MESPKRLSVILVFCMCLLTLSNAAVFAQSELTTKVEDLADKLTSSTSAEIIGIEGKIIYINLGEKDAVSEGAEFEVVRLGEVITVGNKALHKERPIGELQITKVRKEMSLAKVIASFAQIEKGDRVYQKRKKVKRIALTEFPYGENFNNLTKNIYEDLSVSFSQKGLTVVERSQLDKILEAQKIAYSGIIDISTAQKLGQLLGTEAVLLGTVSDAGNNIAIRARLVDVGKGVVITAAQVEVTKNPEILAMLEGGKKGAGSRSGNLTRTPSAGTTQGSGKKPDLFFEDHGVRIDVLSFTREDEGLLLKLKFLNKGNGTSSYCLSKEGTYLADATGNHFGAKKSEIFCYESIRVPPNVPRSFTVLFQHQDSSAEGLILVMQSKYPPFPAIIKGLKIE